MSLRMTATSVTELAPDIWLFDMPPHQIRHFGSTNQAAGSRSVLILETFEYVASSKTLHFDVDGVVPINVGTTTATIGIGATHSADQVVGRNKSDKLSEVTTGRGDKEFLSLAKRELSGSAAKAAGILLTGVRDRSPGELKRGKSRNFSETPDNFWYVIVQPRINEISITVRGPVHHFEQISKLEIKDDRGNTRFKVRDTADVPEALKLIFHAFRKN